MTDRMSIQETFAGRHVLVTGASGFLGKVWLSMLLHRVPDVGRVYVLLRKKGLRPSSDRFEKIVGSSFCFKPLHDQYGAELGAYLAERVEVVEGDVMEPMFGVAPDVLARLRRDLDLVVNVAGLVDFNPDVREALGTNVDGGLGGAELVRSCDHAALLHVSTCYAAGNRSGRIPETVVPDRLPTGAAFDPEAEYAAVQAAADRICAEQETPEVEAALKAEVLDRIRERGLSETNQTLVRNMTHRQRQQNLRKALSDEGKRRASDYGFPNTYTYSKFLAEALLTLRYPDVRKSIFRPAIVESAVSFPFRGWNEGFNTSGPLVYLLSTWFRLLPSKSNCPFDVVPVDLCCNAMTIAGAALIHGTQRPVYQCGSTDRNLLTVGRACELTTLGHRAHLRKSGKTAVERVVLSRWDTVTVEGEHLFSTSNMRSFAKSAAEALRNLPGKTPKALAEKADKLASLADDAEKQLSEVEKIVELFMPFIHDNHFIFEAQALKAHEVVEPEFRFEPEEIDWRRYWIDSHMPGLRRWCFPQIEGKTVEAFVPAHPFSIPADVDAAVAGQHG